MALTNQAFSSLKAKVLEPDRRQLWEKASVEYARFHEEVRSFEHNIVHTKKLYRLWHMADGRKPPNWPKHREWPITQGFRELWGDPLPRLFPESARAKLEFQILVLSFAHGLTEMDADCLIVAWWQYHDIHLDQMAYRVFLSTIFSKAWSFTKAARDNCAAREKEEREAAKTERRNNPAKTANRIRAILTVGPASVDEVTAQLNDVNRATVKKQCQRMEGRGDLEKLPSGQYRLVPNCEASVRNDTQTVPAAALVVLTEEDRRILKVVQLVYTDVDEAKYLTWREDDSFQEKLELFKQDYDYLFNDPAPPPVEEPSADEAPKARLPF